MPPKARAKGKAKGRGKQKAKARSPSPAQSSPTVEENVDEDADGKAVEPHQPLTVETDEDCRDCEDTDGAHSVVSVATEHSKKAKRLKVVGDFSLAEENDMAEWLEQHPILYDKKRVHYKNSEMKERLWVDQADKIGKAVLVLKTWYSCLRTRFGRLKKKTSGSEDPELTEQDQWIVRAFEFLRPYIHEVHKRTPVSIKDKLSPKLSQEHEEDEDHAGTLAPPRAALPPSQQSTSAAPKRSHKQMTEAEDTILADLDARSRQMVELQHQFMDHLAAPPADRDKERNTFCDWIRTVVVDMEKAVWRRFQAEMNGTLLRYIAENDIAKDTGSPSSSQQASTQQSPTQLAPSQLASSQLAASQQAPPQQATLQQCWQPAPSQWPAQVQSNVSVWGSHDAAWVSAQMPQQQQQQYTLTQLPIRSASAGPNFMGQGAAASSTPRSDVAPSPILPLSAGSFHLSQLITDEEQPQQDIEQ